MIECTSENIWYKKRKRTKFKSFIAFFLSFIIVVLVFLYYKYVISTQICNICTSYAFSYASEAANYAVSNTLQDKLSYNELIEVQKNANGDIVLMSANSQKINQINRNVANITSENLKNKLNSGVPVPILAFTGLDVISGLGRQVYLKAVNVASVICDFNSTFNSVGINQTLHSIYIDVLVKVEINFPLNKTTVQNSSTILISETVLIGKVPEIYLSGKIFG